MVVKEGEVEAFDMDFGVYLIGLGEVYSRSGGGKESNKGIPKYMM